ncbi:MAG: multidrug efflux SMR transporter [Alphaproteobacteria bacterium]
MNPWAILAGCILAEVCAVTLLTKSDGLERVSYGLAAMPLFLASYWAMAQVLTRIPVAVTYAVWSGAGVALVTVIGWTFLRQPLSMLQLACIALIAIGAVGLNLQDSSSH